MATARNNFCRKYSLNMPLNEAMDQLDEQLHRLLDNTEIDFSKRKKILLQLERNHNQYRRSIEQIDCDYTTKFTKTADLIRRIKKQIILEEHQQRQRRKGEQEQMDNHPCWSSGQITILVGAAMAGVVSVATWMIIMLDNSKQFYISNTM